MLRIFHRQGSGFCDGIIRREVLRAGAIALGGLSLPGLLSLQRSVAGERSRRLKSIVILYLSGGPSHLDMWDLKPDAPAEIRGTFQPISTRVSGLQICEHLPRTAAISDKITIVRSMSHDEGDHLRGGYWAMTGGRLARPIVQASGMERGDRPHLGSVLDHLISTPNTIPSFVMIPEFISPVGVARPGQYAGFLGPAHDPYLIASDPNLPEYDPGALRSRESTPAVRWNERRSLLAHLEPQQVNVSTIRSMETHKQRALDLISSNRAQQAFDVSLESEQTRNRYGRHVFGQSTLVARRLIEAGVRLVQVNFMRHDKGKGGQGYDSHSVPPNPPHLAWAKDELLPPTDAAFASLVEDLQERGLLDETLVVMMGEFGRTPKFNKDGGRDHWPFCYSLVLAGGGVRGGHVHGASDRMGAYPVADPLNPEDLMATIYQQLGIDPHHTLHDLQNRPYPLTTGTPVANLWG